MRCVAGVGLLALVGCNRLFGIAATHEFDASIDVIPDVPQVKLVWQVASVLASGDPDPELALVPIVPAPRVRIATLDGPFEPASYSSEDGSIAIPRSYLGTTWRLEYAVAGVVHEVQWAPEDKLGRVTVPVFGRVDRAPVPSGGGYTTSPTGVPPFTVADRPRVLTTGLWTEGLVEVDPGATEIDYDFFFAAPLSGANGRPDPARGDRAMVVNYNTDSRTTCRSAVGSAVLASAAIEPGMHTPVGSTWNAATKMARSPAVDPLLIARLANLGLLQEGTVKGSRVLGRGASTGMPGLSAVSPLLPLPVPMMQTLVQCPYDTPLLLPDAAHPTALESFPPFLHVQIFMTRQVRNPDLNLSSGLATVAASGDTGEILNFGLSFPAALATNIELVTPAATVIDLSGASDHVAAAASSGSFTLRFMVEAATGTRNDYYDVLLHRVDSGGLITERIYTVAAPAVRIDGSVFEPGAEYVFEIRAVKGHVMAPRGDFAPVDFPYGSAVVFARTFKIS